MKHLLAAMLIYILTQASVSAAEKIKSKKTSHRSQTRALMKEQIKLLKEGVLLVRLQTQNNSIAALNKISEYEQAAELKEKQENKNREIIAAFRTNFTFCPVYFFTSDYSANILSKQTSEIVFLNDSLQPDTSVKLTTTKFLTAEFGIIDSDTVKYYSDYYYYPGKNGLEKHSAYYSGPGMGFEVLKIMSDQFVQLKRPFPFKVRTFSTISFFKRNYSKAVMIMNDKLLEFYRKIMLKSAA